MINNKLIQDFKKYLTNKEVLTDEEQRLLKEIEKCDDNFVVCVITRDDIAVLGYKTSGITDDDMSVIASDVRGGMDYYESLALALDHNEVPQLRGIYEILTELSNDELDTFELDELVEEIENEYGKDHIEIKETADDHIEYFISVGLPEETYTLIVYFDAETKYVTSTRVENKIGSVDSQVYKM